MQYPKGEIVWLEARDANKNVSYIITSPSDRHIYYLYTLEADGSWRRWGKSPSAGELAQKYEESRK